MGEYFTIYYRTVTIKICFQELASEGNFRDDLFGNITLFVKIRMGCSFFLVLGTVSFFIHFQGGNFIKKCSYLHPSLWKPPLNI